MYHAQYFPQCLLFLFSSSLKNNSYLKKLLSSKYRKLYQQNTSMVWVSAVAQISPDVDQFRSWINGVLAFLRKKPEDMNISCLGLPSLPWWPGLACLVCLKVGPTLLAVGLLIGQIKELTQYWVNSTNQSKEGLSFGQAFKPPRQAQANSQLNQKYYN